MTHMEKHGDRISLKEAEWSTIISQIAQERLAKIHFNLLHLLAHQLA